MKTLLLFLFSCSLWAQSTVTTFTTREFIGVPFSLQVNCFPYTGAYLTPATSRVLAPNGTDVVPYQQTLSDHKICIQMAIPQSTVNAEFTGGGSVPVDATADTITFIDAGMALPVGKMVYFTATSPTCGLSDATNYFVVASSLVSGILQLSATLGGSPVNLTGTTCGTSVKLTLTGFTSVGSTDVITQPGHNRSNREPVKFYGTRPAGITEGTQYYIISATANTYQISATVAGSAVNIGDLTGGINEVRTDWTWTLQSGTTAGGSVTNQLVIDRSSSTYDLISNGRFAVRAGKFVNPTNTYTVAGGTLTSVVESGGVGTTVITLPSPHGNDFSNGDPVCVSGITAGLMNWCSTVASHTATTVTMTGGSGYDGTVTTAPLTVVNKALTGHPIQGVQLSSAEWIGTGGVLYVPGETGGGYSLGDILTTNSVYFTRPTPYNLSFMGYFTEAGPLVTIWTGSYVTNRPVYVTSGNVPVAGTNTAGTGVYSITLTCKANAQSCLVAESTDMNYMATMDLYTAWPAAKPDQRKFRYGSYQDGAPAYCGFVGPLTITGATNANPIKLTFNHPHGLFGGVGTITVASVGGNTAANVTANEFTVVDETHITLDGVDGTMSGVYTSGGTATSTGLYAQSRPLDGDATETFTYAGTRRVSTDCNADERKQIGVWQNANVYGGHQHSIANGSASSSAPVFAIYSGRASLATTGAVTYPAITGFRTTATPALSLDIITQPTFDGGYSGRETGIFTGTKADINTTDNPLAISALTLEQNIQAGVNLTMISAIDPLFADPVGGWVQPLIPDASQNTLTSNYQGNSPSGYTTLINNSTGNNTANIRTMMLGTTSAAIDTVLVTFKQTMLRYFSEIVLGDGIYAPTYAGTGLTTTIPSMYDLRFILGRSFVTSDQKVLAKAYAALLAGFAINQTIYPTVNSCADSCGTANQAVDIPSTQNIAAILFSENPTVALFTPTALSRTTGLINTALNPYGALAQSDHYQETFQPVLEAILTQKKLNGVSPIAYPRLARFCEFILDTMTPPDPRFGSAYNVTTGRKRISRGDGAVEYSNLFGLCATIWNGVQ